jgi:renalase
MSESTYKIAIIGGGISGLTCAQRLKDSGFLQPTVIEKARGVGGRMATRRLDSFQFDHGAQFLKSTTGFSQPLVEPWGDVFTPAPTANALCKNLAQGISVLTETKVDIIKARGTQWCLATEEEDIDTFDAVILTAPPIQTFELLPLGIPFKQELLSVDMAPCFSLMVGFHKKIPCDWLYQRPKTPSIVWIANNSSKPQRTSTPSFFVAQTSSDWSRKSLERTLEEIQEELLKTFLEITHFEKADIQTVSVHRWRYAITEKPLGKTHLWDNSSKLGICGDWLLGKNVSCAIQSGTCLADEVVQAFSKNRAT